MKRLLTIFFVFIACVAYAQKGTIIPDKPASTPAKQNVKAKTSSPESISGKYQIWTIDAQTYPCKNNSVNNCLRVKKQASNDFEILEEDIDNFKYELGYIYMIQIKEVMKTPPISGNESVYKYMWVKTLSKKESTPINNTETTTPKTIYTPTNGNGKTIGQTNIQTSSLLDGKWYLRKLKESEGHSFVTDDNIMWIEIKTFSDYFTGFGACNTFEAKVQSDLNTTFVVSKLTTRYATCGQQKIEDLFYELLQQADRFEIKDGILTLSKQWSYLLKFISDPNNKEEITDTYTPSHIIKTEDKIYATDKVITPPEPQPTVAPEQNKQPVVLDNSDLEKLLKENTELRKALAEKNKQEPIKTEEKKVSPVQTNQPSKSTVTAQTNSSEKDNGLKSSRPIVTNNNNQDQTKTEKSVADNLKTKTEKQIITENTSSPVNLNTTQINDLFSSGTPITYVGIDFSHSKYYGSLGVGTDPDIPGLLKQINYIIPNEYEKYNISKALKKDKVSIKLDLTEKVNKGVNESGFISYNSDGMLHQLNEDSISKIVNEYDLSNYKKEIGLVFIVDNMSKTSNNAAIWVTFFDINSKKVILSEMMTGKAAGFGFRNYWARPFNEIISNIEEKELKNWKLKYAEGHTNAASITTTSENISENYANIPDPDFEKIVYAYYGNDLQSLERTDALYKGTDKTKLLEIAKDESNVQYKIKNQPKFIIKLSNTIPDEFISLYSCNFKKDKRIIDLYSKENTISFTFKKVKQDLYEIILPSNTPIGEYVFVTSTNKRVLQTAINNSTTLKVTCFGISQ
ncbi:MAG: hypothetical protein JWN78_3068 [Bacteroidota bacterium]|nr:hypothetical protein [Bacteroidota bacterium]